MYITLQLHITGRCNCRCQHCYIERHATDMPFDLVETAFLQFDVLIKRLKKEKHEPIRPQLRITGGEPLMHADFERILRLACRKKYQIGIMSNGTLLEERHMRMLKRANLLAFQVSLDGTRETHDRLRGQGNFDRVLCGLELLHRYGIPTRVSFTAHAGNYKEFPAVAAVCRAHHVRSLWSDRYIPFGNGELRPLGAMDMPLYVDLLCRERLNPENEACGLFVQNQRALQFLGETAEAPYFCRAGECLIAVDEKGNIMPCRRLPLVCGSLSDSTLSRVYFESEVLRHLREHCVPEACRVCRYAQACKGGSRCMTYALTHDVDQRDPCCYL